ncbi:YihY family inner membrane protein [Pedobacter sp. LMG 31464]|uniref:YihY family inner membrane protein n=1 Tax=Pedobacter planticolens TaxID=2679964 RepID=A0A923IUC8_9SPHI|nr:YihY/virulence factor BrkB family protein [Pedobacter planticolens]MBB2144029.1 YihY family inner membrane protein [Pedobacter planticolens]
MTNLIKKAKNFLISTVHLFIAAGKGFSEDRVTKLSAALAYYTIFSLSPLIIIVISSASLIYSQDAIENKLFSQINKMVGHDAAVQIQGFVANASLSGKSSFALVIGIIILVIGATAVFTEIQDSINLIWKVKAVPKKGWKKLLTNRLLSFSLIVSLGFLLLVSLVVNSVVLSFGDKLSKFIPEITNTTAFIILILNNVLTFIVVTGVFAVIFKVLPDVILKWKSALIGAAFTALLFGLGKYLIGLYLEKSNPGLVFGSAGSVIIILVWIYYTAIILYFGAEFTQVYAEKYDESIAPTKYAVHLKTIIVEKKVTILPPQHPEDTVEQP